jgi:OmpA-OmpF porin, OOP family
MKNWIPLLYALLGILLAGGSFWYQRLGCGCNENLSAIEAITPLPHLKDTDQPSGISIADLPVFKADYADNLRFLRSGFAALTPWSDSLDGVFRRTAAYLKAHPERSLTITGQYQEGETNNSAFPDLGLARANHIKTAMVEMGAPAGQIDLKSMVSSTPAFRGDTLWGGASYAFETLKRDDTRIAAIGQRLKGKPIVLYFDTNQSEPRLGDQQRRDFADLTYYLGQVPAAKVAVSGHTDNQGNRAANLKLSTERAGFARDYLVRNGIESAKISASGKGPDQPAADNRTEMGRAQNRRTEVTLQ